MAKKDTALRADPTRRPTLRLDADVVAQLCRLLGLDPKKDKTRVRAQVEALGAIYHRWIRQERTTPTLPKQRHRLVRLARLAKQLLAQLDWLDQDHDAQFHLMRAYNTGERLPRDAPGASGLELLASDHLHVKRLAAAAATVQGAIRVTKGPSRRRSLYLLVAQLGHLYEEATGQPVTHTRADDPAYPGAPASPAGRFITAAVRAIDPRVTPTQIASAMRQGVWTGRARSSRRSST